MYKLSPSGWLKHLDFMIIDFICLQMAFLIGYFLENGLGMPYTDMEYLHMVTMVTIFDYLIIFFCECYRGILRRGYLQEFKQVLRQTVYLVLLYIFYIFILEDEGISRNIIISMGIAFAVLIYPARLGWKHILRHRRKYSGAKRSMVVVTTFDKVEELLNNIREYTYESVRVTGIILVNSSYIGSTFQEIPVVADLAHAAEYIRKEWVDEVFVSLPKSVELPEKLIADCSKMGVTLHLELAEVQKLNKGKQVVENFGGYTVLSNCANTVTTRQLFLKRTMDIAVGFVGCLITAVLTVFIGPAIYLKSPGPVFFSQTRVGKNGRRFKIYKFRSMYLDAEERKAELMAHNKVKDGRMFKMENDPRIIGGENGKGIGNFIRNTSLDEFPQFWNVLKGDMSLVGTRPPTEDEWDKYELHHRMRLAIKPGMTGMWQVSGRSDITDFEEVVKLDTEYIVNWSVGMDIKMMFKTVRVVLTGRGAE